MSARKYLSLVFALSVSILIWACSHTVPYIKVQGETMGTYYKLTAQSEINHKELESSVDQILIDLNQVLSTYIPNSEISILNQSIAADEEIVTSDMLWTNVERAAYWNKETSGYFDPSVMPLVNHWGFGYEGRAAATLLDSVVIDSILQFVGFSNWELNMANKSLTKSDARQQLDLSAIAKGYGVDEIARYLEEKGIVNYLIDIGGEMRGSGINAQNVPWSVGINTPTIQSSPQQIMSIIRLEDRAIASSGNYRNYHKTSEGVYGHTINPLSGYPYQDKLLAVSILADNCMDADAIATSCMAMGYDKAVAFVKNLENIEACFYSGSNTDTITTTFTDGFIQYVVKQ